MLVSVIIPTYNRVTECCNLIDSLLLSDYSNIEIIVVDNNSDDGTGVVLNENYIKIGKPVVIVTLPHNTWTAGGRNAGAKVAKGDYLLFIDDDNVVTPTMITQLVKSFTDGVGLVSPVFINVKTNKDILVGGGEFNFLTSRSTRVNFAGADSEKALYEICYADNAFMVSKEVVEKVGGHDEIYFMMYDDADFGYRIKNSGFKMFTNKNAVTHHYHVMKEAYSQKLRLLGIETPVRTFHFAKNRSIFMRKFAPWYCLLIYFLIIAHLACAYYASVSLAEKRFDIALAYLKGTWKGFFIKIRKGNYIEL